MSTSFTDLKLIKRISDKITPAFRTSGSDTEVSNSEDRQRLSSKGVDGSDKVSSQDSTTNNTVGKNKEVSDIDQGTRLSSEGVAGGNKVSSQDSIKNITVGKDKGVSETTAACLNSSDVSGTQKMASPQEDPIHPSTKTAGIIPATDDTGGVNSHSSEKSATHIVGNTSVSLSAVATDAVPPAPQNHSTSSDITVADREVIKTKAGEGEHSVNKGSVSSVLHISSDSVREESRNESNISENASHNPVEKPSSDSPPTGKPLCNSIEKSLSGSSVAKNSLCHSVEESTKSGPVVGNSPCSSVDKSRSDDPGGKSLTVESDSGGTKSADARREESDKPAKTVESGSSKLVPEKDSPSGLGGLPAQDSSCETGGRYSQVIEPSIQQNQAEKTNNTCRDPPTDLTPRAADIDSSTGGSGSVTSATDQTLPCDENSFNADETDSCSQDVNMNCQNTEINVCLKNDTDKDVSDKLPLSLDEHEPSTNSSAHCKQKEGQDTVSDPSVSHSSVMEEKTKSQAPAGHPEPKVSLSFVTEDETKSQASAGHPEPKVSLSFVTEDETKSQASAESTSVTVSKSGATEGEDEGRALRTLPTSVACITSPSTTLPSSKAEALVTSSLQSPAVMTTSSSQSSAAALASPQSACSPLSVSPSNGTPASAQSTSPASIYKAGLQKTIESCKAKLGLNNSSLENNDDDDAFLLGMGDDGEEDVDSDALLMDIDENEDDFDDGGMGDSSTAEEKSSKPSSVAKDTNLSSPVTLASNSAVSPSLPSSLVQPASSSSSLAKSLSSTTATSLSESLPTLSPTATTSLSSQSVHHLPPAAQTSETSVELSDQSSTTSLHDRKIGAAHGVDNKKENDGDLQDPSAAIITQQAGGTAPVVDKTSSIAAAGSTLPKSLETENSRGQSVEAKEEGSSDSLAQAFQTQQREGDQASKPVSSGPESDGTDKTMTPSAEAERGSEHVILKLTSSSAGATVDSDVEKANEKGQAPADNEDAIGDDPVITSSDPPPIITIDDGNSSDDDSDSDDDDDSNGDEGDRVSLDMEVTCEEAARESDTVDEDEEESRKQLHPPSVAATSSSSSSMISVTQAHPHLSQTLKESVSSAAAKTTAGVVSSGKFSMARWLIRAQQDPSVSLAPPAPTPALPTPRILAVPSSASTGPSTVITTTVSSTTAKSQLTISSVSGSATTSTSSSHSTLTSTSRNLPPSFYLHSKTNPSLSTSTSAQAPGPVVLSVTSLSSSGVRTSSSSSSSQKQLLQPRIEIDNAEEESTVLDSSTPSTAGRAVPTPPIRVTDPSLVALVSSLRKRKAPGNSGASATAQPPSSEAR